MLTVDIIAAMALPKFSVLNDEWQVHEGVFASPTLNPDQDDQTVVFAQTIKDGSISAAMTPESGAKGAGGYAKKELALVFRYNGQELCYAAGIGGWDAKYFISRMSPGNWQLLASSGKSASLQYTASYDMRVEFTGSKITLFENDVPHLSVMDETYKSGQWGLRARKTVGRFDDITSTCVRPRCFVIMPFSSPMSYVYEVIKKVVEASEMSCIRADEVFVSRPAVDQIRSEISQADLVIVDFTGRNPNVYYEAGLADAWKKRWIVLAQSPNDLTFDVQHIRTIFYSDRMGADVKARRRPQECDPRQHGCRFDRDGLRGSGRFLSYFHVRARTTSRLVTTNPDRGHNGSVYSKSLRSAPQYVRSIGFNYARRFGGSENVNAPVPCPEGEP